MGADNVNSGGQYKRVEVLGADGIDLPVDMHFQGCLGPPLHSCYVLFVHNVRFVYIALSCSFISMYKLNQLLGDKLLC